MAARAANRPAFNAGSFITRQVSGSGTKTYTIGTDVTFAPFEFANQDNKYVGIDLDLIKAIAKTEGFKVEIKPLGFNAAVQALKLSKSMVSLLACRLHLSGNKVLMSDPLLQIRRGHGGGKKGLSSR